VLTADLVRARRKGDELAITALKGKTRSAALEVAERLIDTAREMQGASRGEVEQRWQTAATGVAKKLGDGLRKLVEDRCDFEVRTEHSPSEMRQAVFIAAAAARTALPDGESFDRAPVLAEQAQALGLSVTELEQALYADLRAVQRLMAFRGLTAEQLLEVYDRSQAQAVLLKAVEVVAEVHCKDAYAYRVLFRKLKFHRLLHRVEPLADGGYRLVIDGPFSLFSSSTKYGLSLALSLPAIQACDRYKLSAALRWGPERRPLVFKLEGKGARAEGDEGAALPDEVAAFVERFAKLKTPWKVAPSADILEVPGAGVSVPDLRFENADTGEVAYLEVMGFWSREAVFKRVELVRAGLDARVLFAVSSRLRVSEAVLDEADIPSELYVYKGALNPRELLRRLDAE